MRYQCIIPKDYNNLLLVKLGIPLVGIPLNTERVSKGEYCMGRLDQGNESWDRERLTAARLAALNGRATGKQRAISTSTGEYRAIPRRPPNMPQHLETPPDIPRVARPQRQTQPTRLRPRLIILGTIAAIIAVFAFVIFTFLVGAINQSTGPTLTAVDFVSSIATQNYDNAYQDLGPAVTIRINRQEFTQKAKEADQQNGIITNYELDKDKKATLENNTQSFTYVITRKNKTYKLTILLQSDPNDGNNWKIVDYGTNCNATVCFGTTLGPN
jgi:hypothetical protein